MFAGVRVCVCVRVCACARPGRLLGPGLRLPRGPLWGAIFSRGRLLQALRAAGAAWWGMEFASPVFIIYMFSVCVVCVIVSLSPIETC